MAEDHWAYMDRFAATMIARGPTSTDDDTLTGSVHVLVLPDATAARAFAFEEPGYQAGAYRDVAAPRGDEVIACGHLLSNDGTLVLGAAVVLEVPSAEAARKALSPDNFASIEVRQWEFGGRPT